MVGTPQAQRGGRAGAIWLCSPWDSVPVHVWDPYTVGDPSNKYTGLRGLLGVLVRLTNQCRVCWVCRPRLAPVWVTGD